MAWKNPGMTAVNPITPLRGFVTLSPTAASKVTCSAGDVNAKPRDYPIRLVRAMTSLLRSGGNLPI